MNYDAFNEFCRSLPATTYVVQWGGAHFWKVGGKVFAIGGWADDQEAYVYTSVRFQYETPANNLHSCVSSISCRIVMGVRASIFSRHLATSRPTPLVLRRL